MFAAIAAATIATAIAATIATATISAAESRLAILRGHMHRKPHKRIQWYVRRRWSWFRVQFLRPRH